MFPSTKFAQAAFAAVLFGAAGAQDLLKRSADGINVLFQTNVWMAPNVHYKTSEGWTSSPGEPMKPSARDAPYSAANGWFEHTLTTNDSSVEFVFNDGFGNWDNNNKNNYHISQTGTYTVISKVLELAGSHLVKADDKTGLHVLYRSTKWPQPKIHINAGDGWTKYPGVDMQPSTHGGKFSAEYGWFQYDVNTTSSSGAELAFNDGHDHWDSNLDKNYKVDGAGTYAFTSASPARTQPDGYVNGAGYIVTGVDKSRDGLTISLALKPSSNESLYGADLKELEVQVTEGTKDSVRIKISDKNARRWEVPSSLFAKGKLGGAHVDAKTNARQSLYSFDYTKDPFTFKVTRKEDGYVLFDSSKLAMVLKDQYLQISTAVPEDLSVYGIGESTRDSIRMSKGDKHTLWARDQGAFAKELNLYGSHPFYMGVNGEGKAHGVFLLNSNGMDVTMEDDKLVYQTIGGVLDFHILAGPTPNDVVAQYTALIGRPKLQPYWSYGFHQCRWGYKNAAQLREVVDKYAAAKIPLDVLWSDIDYMNKYHDFTLDEANFARADMKKLLDDIHANGQKYVPIIDPGIPDDETDVAYTMGLEMDVYIKDSTTGKPFLGQVWPGPTVFPDFFHPNSTSYWNQQLARFHEMVPFDGLWIDMNELANFCPGTTCARGEQACPNGGDFTTCCLVCVGDGNKYDNPPFVINNSGARIDINDHAVSASALHHDGQRQYDTHNLYGLTEAIATDAALRGLTDKRSFVLSRSTFPGSGVHTAHWTGDNAATWNDLQWSIPQMLNFGLYGIPMVGSDICGFAQDTTPELCARWTALGAFYPFSRNHNNIQSISQETYLWPEVAAAGRKFLGLRYRLLPYIYTLGYEAHVNGKPIARALFMEFPQDANARTCPAVDRQFLLGGSVLVTPVLEKGAKSVTGYLPAGTWYNMFDYSRMESAGQSAEWKVKIDDMPVHVRGGSILALHQPSLTSAAARESPFDILVALPSDDVTASGQLYLDDGEDLDGDKSTLVKFTVDSSVFGTKFSSKAVRNQYSGASSKTIKKLVVLGTDQPKCVRLGLLTLKCEKNVTYDAATRRLEVDVSKANLRFTDTISIMWR